jgi:PEP-CTERM motif
MKERLAVLVVLLAGLAFFSLPALAQQTVYDNGPINGTTDAWTINSGFEASNRFSCCRDDGPGSATITGLQFGAWLFPGDVVESVEVSITSSEFGGTTYFDGVVSLTQSGCSANQFGFNVCTESGNFAGPALAAGNYWLNLSNAVVNDGDPVYWDENSGVGCQSPGCPSIASENEVGTIPSEAFTLLGNPSTSGGGSVPEPGSALLLGSGIVAVVGWVRRKFFV